MEKPCKSAIEQGPPASRGQERRQVKAPKTPGGGRRARPLRASAPGRDFLADDLMNRWMALPEITLPRTAGRRPPTGGANSRSQCPAHYDVLRTKLPDRAPQEADGARVADHVSDRQLGGKSTTAFNLALAIARQGEPDATSLYDLDLRRPAGSRALWALIPRRR